MDGRRRDEEENLFGDDANEKPAGDVLGIQDKIGKHDGWRSEYPN